MFGGRCLLVRVSMFGGRCWSGYPCLADDAGPGTHVWRTMLVRVPMFGGRCWSGYTCLADDAGHNQGYVQRTFGKNGADYSTPGFRVNTPKYPPYFAAAADF
eukprot:gene2800-biopygen547